MSIYSCDLCKSQQSVTFLNSNKKHHKHFQGSNCNIIIIVTWFLLCMFYRVRFYLWVYSWHFGQHIVNVIQVALPGWLCLRFLPRCVLQCPLQSALRLRDASVAPMRLVRQAFTFGRPGPTKLPSFPPTPPPTTHTLLGPSTDSHHNSGLSVSFILSSPISLSLKSRHWSVNIRVR